MRRADVALLGVVACLVAGCASVLERRAAAVDRYLADLHARGLFQGAVVLGRDGQERYARGFGLANAGASAAFTPDTPTDGASITKTFTAAAVMGLVHERRIDLEAPVQRYLPTFPHASTRVRHLLAHSAGLPDYDWFDRLVPPPALRTNADQLALLRREGRAPAFVPGSRFAYDNVAYDVAAMVVEAVGGETYERHVRRAFFEPLGMRASFLRPARLADFPGTRTQGYRGTGDGAKPFDAIEGEGFYGGGNLYFSARDLHSWAAAFATRPPIAAEAFRAGMERARLDDGRRTHLALLSWYSSPDGARHYYLGHHNGFYNFVYWDASTRTSIAMVSNNGLAATLGAALPRALIALADGREPEARHILPAADLPAEVLAGEWRVEGIGPVSIRVERTARYLRVATGVEFRMYRVGPGVFAVPGLEGWIRFHGDANAPSLTWDSIFLLARGTRVPGG